MSDEGSVALQCALSGFVRLGASYWPGAHHYLLVELRGDNQLTGDAWPVCASCVREAAWHALACLERGGNRRLDLVGESETGNEPCVICHSEI